MFSQVDELLERMRLHVAKAGFKDAGVQPMSGSEEALAEWMAVNMLLGSFEPGLQGVRSPAAVLDLGGATLQMAYHLHDRQATRARRSQMEHFVTRVSLPGSWSPKPERLLSGF